MRQLMVWAVQKVRSSLQEGNGTDEMMETVLQGLFTNKINTSWYQRPALPPITREGESTERGPKNQELLDCIQLYERYNQKLRAELVTWNHIQNHPSPFVSNLSLISQNIMPRVPLFERETRQALEGGCRWFNSLPETVDQIKWTLTVASSFEDHARAYCEAVFQQISARLFGGNVRPEPMMLLRALSTYGTNS